LPQTGGEVVIGVYRLEPQNRQMIQTENGTVIRLTEKETALLDYLAQSTAPVTREELLAAIWGYDGRIDTHTLETHIYQLRRKLDPEEKGDDLLVNEGGSYRLKRIRKTLVNPDDTGVRR
jgi:DNA-binding response OmpR family regulator